MTEKNNDWQSEDWKEFNETQDGEKKKLYDVSFFYSWCKACGLCEALCPKKIIKTDKAGIPEITDPDACTGCRFCEKHCPDFAITVCERMPRRRKTDV